MPLALWALGSAFLVFLGFAPRRRRRAAGDGDDRASPTRCPATTTCPSTSPNGSSSTATTARRPIYAGDWLSSDRPPLQVGFALAQRPFGWDLELLDYQVLGVVLQQLWIVGLWALLLAAGVGRVTRALAMVAVLVSDLAIVNGFFVWPKLLPAAMLLAAAALVLTPLWPELRRNLWAAALVAALCALAMLGHGSSVFGIIPLAAGRRLARPAELALARGRGRPSGSSLMAPWSAYQKWGDPPGNRLTKWTLAGVAGVDDRGAVEAILDAYGEAGLGGTLDNKARELQRRCIGWHEWRRTRSGRLRQRRPRRNRSATSAASTSSTCLPSLGLLLLAPLAMAAAWRRRRRDPAEWSFALTCFAILVIGAVALGPDLSSATPIDSTVIHFGSYLLPMIGIVGAVAGLRAVFPRFALCYVGAQRRCSACPLRAGARPAGGQPSYSPLADRALALAGSGRGAVQRPRASELAGRGRPALGPATDRRPSRGRPSRVMLGLT